MLKMHRTSQDSQWAPRVPVHPSPLSESQKDSIWFLCELQRAVAGILTTTWFLKNSWRTAPSLTWAGM